MTYIKVIAGNSIKTGNLLQMKRGKAFVLKNITHPVAVAGDDISKGDTIEIRDGLAFKVPEENKELE